MDQKAFGQICHSYYQKLYTARTERMETAVGEAVAISCVEECVPSDMKLLVQQTISLAELKKEVDEMKPRKAPGPDGIVLEFYKVL